MDFVAFQFINNLADRWWLLDFFGIFCAQYLIFVMIFIAASLLIVWKDKVQLKTHWIVACKAFFAVALGYILKLVIQLIYARPRPFITHEVLKLINKSADASFPSAHTLISFAVAFSIYFYNKKLGYILLVLAAFVGLGRIYVGVHYPLDVLGGMFVGFLSAYVIEKIPWNKLLKNKA